MKNNQSNPTSKSNQIDQTDLQDLEIYEEDIQLAMNPRRNAPKTNFSDEKSLADEIEENIKSIKNSLVDSLSSSPIRTQNKSSGKLRKSMSDSILNSPGNDFSDEKSLINKLQFDIKEMKKDLAINSSVMKSSGKSANQRSGDTVNDFNNKLHPENFEEEQYKKEINRLDPEYVNNCRYLISTDFNGILKQFDIKHDTKFVRSYGKVHAGPIHSMAATRDSKYLFTGDWDGNLKQFVLYDDTLKLCYDYGEVHKRTINSMCIDKNSQYLFTSSTDGCIKQFDIEKRMIYRDYGCVHDSIIYSIDQTNDGKYLFTSDKRGKVYQWMLKEDHKCLLE